MIIDAHTHVWEHWPYQSLVPDPGTRARVEQLLFEMDQNGVERAVVICARIGDNAHNVDYAYEASARHPGRLLVFPDLECRWAPDFRTPGAVQRLEQALSRWDFAGFTQYLDASEDGSWLTGPEGLPFMHLAAERSLLVSMSALPHQMEAVRALAIQLPSLHILLHHLAHMGDRHADGAHSGTPVISLADCPNIHLKYSGMGNITLPPQEFPYPDAQSQWAPVLAAFGADRIIWGSDYPVCLRHMTYGQTVSMLTRHAPFPAGAHKAILHDNMARLLRGAGAVLEQFDTGRP
ncbi:amidohydrolase family protein [Devosia submarina]|uniref:amidohydrolase family protein n=1 Tax=Devosia submarina TaxID=1173082 RepID=UPI000D332D81|nr:amidohydrolase family protein [Devosia submarina]